MGGENGIGNGDPLGLQPECVRTRPTLVVSKQLSEVFRRLRGDLL